MEDEELRAIAHELTKSERKYGGDWSKRDSAKLKCA